MNLCFVKSLNETLTANVSDVMFQQLQEDSVVTFIDVNGKITVLEATK